MKTEKLFDVLMYLFENYISKSNELVYTNPKLIEREMFDAGFNQEEVNKILYWFENLAVLSNFHEKSKKSRCSIRVYTKEESKKISIEARNYLFYLERLGIIDVGVREFVVEQAMNLDINVVTVKDIKCIVCVVIFKGPYRSKMKQQLLATLIVEEDKKVRN